MSAGAAWEHDVIVKRLPAALDRHIRRANPGEMFSSRLFYSMANGSLRMADVSLAAAERFPEALGGQDMIPGFTSLVARVFAEGGEHA